MAPAIPRQLGRYEVLDELGRGAMGVVYLARDPLIGRLLALKTLHGVEGLDPAERAQFRERFLREAQSAGNLSHPNVVAVHDVVDSGEEGTSFIALEYVRGTPLKEILKGGNRLELSTAVDILEQVAAALDYAHSKDVVHRDVKPGNILIANDGRVKLMDFGIARVDTSNLTRDTQLVGTPNYMSPEQVEGSSVGPGTDVFSLGIVLYEMLTGAKPFAGESLAAVSHRIVYGDFTPPTEHRPELPPEIDGIVERALAKEPARRYASAGALVGDLGRLVGAAAAGAGESADLNETMAVPLPELEAGSSPPRGSGAATVAAGARRPRLSASRGAAGLRERLAALPRPVLTRGRPSRRRALGVALVTLVAALLLGWLAIVWASPEPREPPTAAERAERERELAFLEQVREGYRQLEAENPAEAAAAFRRAERIAPNRPQIRRIREVAELQAQTSARLSELERGLAEKLARAQDALSAGRWSEARELAREVLELAPEDAEAQEIEGAAEEGIARLVARRRAERERAAAEAAPPPPPEPELAEIPPPVPPPLPARDPTLAIRFVSRYLEEPVGNLRVLVDGETVLDFNYRFVERKGPLGLFGGESYAGQVTRPAERIEPGGHDIRVYVTPKNEPALFARLDEARLVRGEDHRLEIRLSSEGRLTAELR